MAGHSFPAQGGTRNQGADMKLKLTEANLPLVEAHFATSGKADRIYFDEELPGFGIRLRAGSKWRVWVCRYEHVGVQRKFKLGTTAQLSAEQARKKAKRVMAEVLLGDDPQAKKAEERAKARLTLRYVANQYLQRQQTKLRPKSLRDTKRYLLTDFGPLHHMPVHKINRRDIAVVLNDLAVKAPTAAVRSRAILSALFSWARGEGYLDGDNPVEGTNIPAPTVTRDRVLSAAELAAVWNNCGNDTYGNIVKLLILTGARREEIGGLRWDELVDGVWTLPASRSKNHRELVLTLPLLAQSILQAVPRRDDTDCVFGNGSRGFNGWHKAKEALDRRCRIAPWRLHDIRRSVATGVADIGIQPHIIEAVLNHVSGHKADVAGVYNRSSYQREVKNALAIWADHVASIVSCGERKILQFPAETG